MTDDAEVQVLWSRWQAGDRYAQEDLVRHYTPLVRYVVKRLGIRAPEVVDYDDLVAYGMIGLLDAFKRFDTERGVKFSTYAVTRIRGAIIDELRRLDWVPRSVRSVAKQVAIATAKLETKLQRAPTHEELATELEVTLEELASMLDDAHHMSIGELDRVTDNEDSTLLDTVDNHQMAAPEDPVGEDTARDILAASLSDLDEKEQRIIALYYIVGLNLGQIGELMGVTESRVCQVHSRSMKALRHRLLESAVA